MDVNAKFRISLIKLAVMLIAMATTGVPAVKAQKQDKEAETYKLAGKYAEGKRWQDLVELCQRYLQDKPSDADLANRLFKLISQ